MKRKKEDRTGMYAVLTDADHVPILDEEGNLQVIELEADAQGQLKTVTELSGNTLEKYGVTVADRPAANSVPVGFVFMAVTTQEMWQSDGANWVVV